VLPVLAGGDIGWPGLPCQASENTRFAFILGNHPVRPRDLTAGNARHRTSPPPFVRGARTSVTQSVPAAAPQCLWPALDPPASPEAGGDVFEEQAGSPAERQAGGTALQAAASTPDGTGCALPREERQQRQTPEKAPFCTTIPWTFGP
jgi:hypothetical protein